jgi:predicted signal transduction protein with EAL and GGDEF domain
VPGTDALAGLGHRLIESLRSPVGFDGQSIRVAASIGAAITEPGARSPDDLLADADVALLEAKRQGKARVHLFDARLDGSVRDRRRRDGEVRQAAAAGQLELHYQPLVSLRDLGLAGVEALVRWRHPVHGLLAPAAFIDTAERLGVVGEIGRWVLERACRDSVAWTNEHGGASVRWGVNVSPRELASARLIDDVLAALEASGCPGTSLCLEITESGIVEDPDAALSNLCALKDLGVLIALDDFGTGFSSLGQLAAFPVDVVKLDRTFVARLTGTDRRSVALVRAVCSMAEALELEAVAEGIESQAQRELLLELGYDVGQGFLLGRPVALDQLGASVVEEHGRLRLADGAAQHLPA